MRVVSKVHHYNHIAESNYDCIFAITDEIYATFYVFMVLIIILLLPLEEIHLVFLVKRSGGNELSQLFMMVIMNSL